MTNTITTNELRRLRSMKSEMLLVDVLPKDEFDKDHIEGAQNVPLESPDFLAKVEKAAGRKDKKIVVYCAGGDCDASLEAATKLTAAGHGDVTAYEGGISDWRKDSAKAGSKQGAAPDKAVPPTGAAAGKPAATPSSKSNEAKTEPAVKFASPESSGSRGAPPPVKPATKTK